jgi:hypothetical protein
MLISFTFSAVFSVATTSASTQSPTIIIRPDGSVDSSSGIQRTGNIYVLTTNLFNSPIEIQRDNIILDGANYTLQGAGKTNDLAAITLKANNVTVTNFHITQWTAGIYGAYDNNTIIANEFTDTNRAIALYAIDFIINKNIIQGNDQGIYIKNVLPTTESNNLVINNQIVNNGYAFNIINSTGTTITQNNIVDNSLILNIIGGPNGDLAAVGCHLFYFNNFVNNQQTLSVSASYLYVMSGVTPFSPVGNWDNGTIGNYWSDYTARYPNAPKTGTFGVGGTAYLIEAKTTYIRDNDIEETVIFGKAVDNYPLIYKADIFTDDIIYKADIVTNENSIQHTDTSWSSSNNIVLILVTVCIILTAIVIIVTYCLYKQKKQTNITIATT